jgi:xanthine dehydrogenase accessory factor
VKHWQETARVLDRAIELGRGGGSTALAVVTRIHGSAYRRPGAKLLIEPEGGLLGGVSGGCLEEDVRQVGLGVLKTGRVRLLRYDTGPDDTTVWGLGLGCDGQVELAVFPIPPGAALGSWSRVRRRLDGDAPVVLACFAEDGADGAVWAFGPEGAVEGDPPPEVSAAAGAALGSGRSAVLESSGRRVFVDSLLPPPKLLVCGGGEDARPLVALGTEVGFRVVIADHRGGYLAPASFPTAHRLLLARADEDCADLPTDRDTWAVVKTHSLKHDTSWVRRLLATDVPYIGVLGPRARTRRLVAELDAEGDSRVFGPVGLDLGADGPEQVAVSVVSEILALRARRAPTHLREREIAVHARD